MNIKIITNSAGLVITIIGVYIVYRNSPLNFDSISGGRADTDFAAIERITKQKNAWIKKGIFFVLIGSVLQLISNFIPEATECSI